MRKPQFRARGPHIPPLDGVVQYPFEPGYVVFTQPTAKRLRVQVGDIMIADTTRALMLWETEHLPVYYFPLADIRMDLMTATGHASQCPYKGTARYYTVAAGGKAIENIMWQYPDPIPGCPPIADYGSFYWTKADHWYEEDEEVFVHARDPYRRIDCLASSRQVQIYVRGVLVADSSRAVFLYETGLPTRFYLPPEDVRADILAASEHRTSCPYKGRASYWHVVVNGQRHENLIWFYAETRAEVAPIRGRLAFYNEKVDRILLDGEELPRPAPVA
ncbi:MAG: DUF427 domain-containing protein [Proteobacteria bacterium]|nr:DUF427 domain-containing protein [Pseudomonadota bacterium]MBI3496362.1 DUF427 domain-containing protein [Pseudomonadota bacterium]